MPYPIPTGQNFEITYNETSAKHHMPTMDESDHFEISLILSGDRQIVTPNRIFYAHSHSITMGAPFVRHQTSSTSDLVYKKILIKFSIKIGDLIKRKIGVTNFDALFDQHVHYFTEIGYDIIQKKFFEMLEVYKDYDRYTDEILQGMLFHLFTLITKYKEMPSNAVPISFETKNESIIKALEYLSTYMQDAPSMEAVASYVGLTPSYFSRLFKKSTGKTFSEYVLFLRLQSSRILLMQTDLSVQQIAEQIGLCNGNYLSNLFKKYYLESPSEFRKHCNPNTQSDIVNKPLYDGL